MNGIALSLDRMYSEIHSHVNQVEQLLCFGATPWEAVMAYVRKVVTAEMISTINSLMVGGMVIRRHCFLIYLRNIQETVDYQDKYTYK